MDKKRIIIISSFVLAFITSIIISHTYYNDKYSIYFETGTNENILTQYVGKNNKVNRPIDPQKEGYVFVEWQLDGETYDFDESVETDTVLTAKWIKEEYVTINFNTNSEYILESKKILKGDIIDILPESNKEGYEFVGWYLNDKLYNDEEIYGDITLNAEYKNNTINTTYKVGNKVEISGEYASSSFAKKAYNTKAIGWEREILDIINDREYPYVVGNKDGVTGYFKASSLKRGE